MGIDSKNTARGKPPINGKVTGVTGKRLNDFAKNSPYRSTLSVTDSSSANAKRTQSATNLRSRSVGPGLMAQKASVFSRKQSDPELRVAADNIQQKPYSSRVTQRRTSFSRTSRLSTDSDHSSDKSYPVSMNQSRGYLSRRGDGDTGPKKRLPFSFSSDFREEPPQPQWSMPTENAKEPQGIQSFQRRPRRHQSVDNGSGAKGSHTPHVHFADSKSDSIEMDIAEQPDETVRDKNESASVGTTDEDIPTRSREFHGLSNDSGGSGDAKAECEPSVGVNRDQGNARQGLSSLKTINERDQKDNVSSNPSSRDEIMIAKTDDLIMEVARFITQIKSSRAEHFPVDIHLERPNSSDQRSEGRSHRSFEDLNESNRLLSVSIDSAEGGLSSISCPSVVRNQSGRSTFRESIDPFDHEGLSSSRPASASFRRAISNEDIHGRISLTLQMIEQEEKRDLMKSNSMYDHVHNLMDRIPSGQSGRLLPSLSNPPSRPSSRSSFRSPQLVHLQPQESSRLSFNNSETRLPKLGSSVDNIDRQTPRSCSCNCENNRPYSRGSNCNSEMSQFPVLSSRPTTQQMQVDGSETDRPKSGTNGNGMVWETSHEKTKKIFSFLDEVEKSDRETLLGLKYDQPQLSQMNERSYTNERLEGTSRSMGNAGNSSNVDFSHLQTMDSLIRKGSVELAREQILLDRKLEEAHHKIHVLEETLIHQRELNMRNLRNSERDLKKRLKLQKEEFDLAFARNEALINEMAAEKRVLQERCDKLMKGFDETEEKYKEQIKSLHQKHLEEIKRLRKAQFNSESVRKQQWVGNKTQEIKEMTVRGLEPEVQRIIQRHQQEMSEMRAWHADEIRETEDRYQRKMNIQTQDLREKFARELEEMTSKEKEAANRRLESELKQREDEFETQRRRLVNELMEERERAASEEMKLKDLMQENVRKAQIKGEIEVENLKQELEGKLANMERRHENELKSLKDVHEAEKDTWMSNYLKKYEQAMKDREIQVTECLRSEMDREIREREKKLREEFDKIRKEDEESADARIKRTQEKFQSELAQMEESEKELKAKFSQAKSDLLSLEEQVFSLKTSLNLKDKQNNELQDANMKMLEERATLTSVIRREFSVQIEGLEEDVRNMRSTLLELQTKHKMELEQCQLEIGKVNQEKDVEIDKIGLRVKHTVSRKEETIQELQKKLDKANFQIQHLEGLIEQQRKDLLESMTKNSTNSCATGKRK